MEYDHGKRVTKHVHEMSLLERAVAEFETQAKSYHAQKNAFEAARETAKKDKSKKPTKDEEKELARQSRELNKLLKDLAVKRLATLTQVSVQDGLEKYRTALKPTENDDRTRRSILRSAMGIEAHHPTDVLAQFMKETGRAAPDQKENKAGDSKSRFTPHHIIQGKGKTRFAADARINLHFHGIRINDPDNGVWMPRFIKDKGHPAMCHACAHSEVHTHNYEHWVHTETNAAVNETAFRGKLEKIRVLLRDGQEPDYVTDSPRKEIFG